MIDLAKYFRILFLSVRISRERLKLFGEVHIQRLATNNPGGIYTTLLTDTTNLYNLYAGDLADIATNEAAVEGKTIGMNSAKLALLQWLQISQENISYIYRNNRERYELFYPHGLTEYDHADLPNFATITTRFGTALTLHAGDFAPAFVAEFAPLKTTFNDNRTAQLAQMGTLAGERGSVIVTKADFASQLTKNLLTIALNNIGNEAVAAVYFDQSILDEAFEGSETLVENDIDNGETQNAFDNTSSPETEYKMKTNTVDKEVMVAFKDSPTAAVLPEEAKLVTNAETTYTAGDLGFSSTNKFLNVTNTSGETVSYRIERV